MMVATLNAPLQVVERPAAPHDLSDEETEIWAAVIDDNPADWFSPSSYALLSQYCRHVISARRVAELIERWPVDPTNPESLSGYLELLKSQKAESLVLGMLATKMRMAQQTTHNQRGNKQPKATKVPWQR